jgi:LemA protein
VLTAKVIGAKPKTYFEVTNPANREAPTVDFSNPSSSAGTSAPASAPPAP